MAQAYTDENGLTGIDTAPVGDVVSLLLPMIIGWQGQLVLSGLGVSMFHDYRRSPLWQKHSAPWKASVWAIMGFLLLASLLSAEETVYYIVWQQRTAVAILTAHWPSGLEPFLTGAVALGVQLLLTNRASAFFPRDSRRSLFLTFNYLVIATSFIGSMMVTAVAYMYVAGTVDNAPFSFSTATLIWLVPAAAADVSISLSLWYCLRNRANESVAGWAFRAVIATALKTASYTAVMAVAGAALAVVAILSNQSNATIDLPFALWIPMPSLYVLSLFTTLSSNKAISRRLVERQEKSIHTGFQPGHLAASYLYVVPPLPTVSSRLPHGGSSISTNGGSSNGRASAASGEVVCEGVKEKE